MVGAALVAVLGVVLVLLYVRGADTRAKDRYAMTPVLVATQTIGVGESFGDAVKSGKLDLQDVVSSDKVADAVTSLSAISNDEVAEAAIYPGEQVLSDRFGQDSSTAPATMANPTLQIPDGDVAISVSLTDPGRVASFVEPGSSVAVFVTGSSATGTGVTVKNSVSRVLLSKVLVLGVGSTGTEASSSTAPGAAPTAPAQSLPDTLLTLAVTQKQAEKILLATAGGSSGYTLSLGLLNDKSKISMGNVVGASQLFDGQG